MSISCGWNLVLCGFAMVVWGNLQSAIQLTIAVNLVYSSFTEIRQSAMIREIKALDSIRQFVSPQSAPVNGDVVQLSIDLNTLENNIARIDHYGRTISLVTSVLYLAMLICSSIAANTCISHWAALCVCTIGFLPPIGFMITNAGIVRFKLRGLQDRREALTSALAAAPPS
jgi:hypothetical protein